MRERSPEGTRRAGRGGEAGRMELIGIALVFVGLSLVAALPLVVLLHTAGPRRGTTH
nr:hypothetical protein GCM10020241_35770 [Streptoalloteichus tenebrarius]